MPFAARFVQDGSITSLHYVDSEPVTVFFPASSELFHSFGMLVMGNDVLSPLLNMLWLGLALLASWCIGRPFGVAPIAVAGCAILFATPGLVGTQPGGAYDDVVGLALLLSSVALLVNAQDLSKRSGEAAWVLAGARCRSRARHEVHVHWADCRAHRWRLVPPEARRASAARDPLAGSAARHRQLLVLPKPLRRRQPAPFTRPEARSDLAPEPAHSDPHIDSRPVPLQLNPRGPDFFLPGLRVSFGPGLVGARWAVRCRSRVGDRDRESPAADSRALWDRSSGVVFLFTPQFLAVYQLRCSSSTTCDMPMLRSSWDSCCCRSIPWYERGDAHGGFWSVTWQFSSPPSSTRAFGQRRSSRTDSKLRCEGPTHSWDSSSESRFSQRERWSSSIKIELRVDGFRYSPGLFSAATVRGCGVPDSANVSP